MGKTRFSHLPLSIARSKSQITVVEVRASTAEPLTRAKANVKSSIRWHTIRIEIMPPTHDLQCANVAFA